MKLKISNRKKVENPGYVDINHYVAEQLPGQDQKGNKKKKKEITESVRTDKSGNTT